MQHLMEGRLIFDNPQARDRATVELNKLGLEVEKLHQVDDDEDGVVLTPSCWAMVRGLYDGSDNDFLVEMGHIANQAGGEVLEAGCQFPPIH